MAFATDLGIKVMSKHTIGGRDLTPELGPCIVIGAGSPTLKLLEDMIRSAVHGHALIIFCYLRLLLTISCCFLECPLPDCLMEAEILGNNKVVVEAHQPDYPLRQAMGPVRRAA
jgi:hypothetical protein